jgi:hypothetical protein
VPEAGTAESSLANRKEHVMKRKWLVQLTDGEERIEADEVEVVDSGTLVFYRAQHRRENERTMLLALSAESWRRCQLESDA